MSKIPTYTIGQIFKLGLLKNQDGQPYKDKATVSNILARYPHKPTMTPHGPGKLYSQTVLDELNGRWSAEAVLK